MQTQDITTFFAALFGGYPENDALRLEIRCLKQGSKYVLREWFALSRLAAAADYCRMRADEYDVYFGVLPRIGRSGSQTDVQHAAVLFADIDGGDDGAAFASGMLTSSMPLRPDVSGLPRPHIAVCSGGGVHAYWLLVAPVALPADEDRLYYKKTLKRFVRVIGGAAPGAHADPSCCDPARILRVPGTYNYKNGGKRPVEILWHEPTRVKHTFGTWGSAILPPEERSAIVSAPVRATTYNALGVINSGLRRWAEKGFPEGKRHHDLTAAAAWLVRDLKLNKADALDLIRTKASASRGARPITEDEMETMVGWA